MPKIDKAVPKHPKIYRVFDVDESGRETSTGIFRVRHRIKIAGKWTTRVTTFQNFDSAKVFCRQPIRYEADAPPKKWTFGLVLEKFFHYKEHEERRAPGTIHGYRSRARHLRFFQELSIREITPLQIDGWVNLLLDPEYKALQLSSREDYDHELVLLGVILRFYREFYDETYVVPLLKRHRKRLCPPRKEDEEIRYLSEGQEIDFLEAMNCWPVLRDVALFQLHTGARVGEAAAMDFDSVEFTRQQVHIRQHLHWERTKGGSTSVLKGTKTGPDRTVPLTLECLQMLRRRRQESGGSVAFTDPKRGSWLTYRAIQSAYDTAFKRLGLPHRGSHTLRHTFAVRFLEQTKDIHALQKALGHTDLSTTMIYAKYTNDSVRKAFQIFRGGGESKVASVPLLVPPKLIV
jgi:integrase